MEENNDGDEGRWGEGLPSDRKNEGEEYSHSPFLPKSSKTLWGDSDYNYPPITPAFRAQGGNKHFFLTGMAPFPTEQIDGGAGNVGPLWAPATLFLYRRRSRGSSKGVDVGMCHIREAIICSKHCMVHVQKHIPCWRRRKEEKVCNQEAGRARNSRAARQRMARKDEDPKIRDGISAF